MSKSPQTCSYTFLPISCLLFCSVCVYVLYVCGGLYITVWSVHQFLWISCIFYLCNRVCCIHVPGYDPTLFFPVLFLFDWVGVLWPQLSKVLKPVRWAGSIPFPPVSLQKQFFFAVAAGVNVFISGESLHCFLVGWCANKKLCYSNLWLVTLHSCFQPAFLNSPPHSLTFVLCIALSAVVKYVTSISTPTPLSSSSFFLLCFLSLLLSFSSLFLCSVFLSYFFSLFVLFFFSFSLRLVLYPFFPSLYLHCCYDLYHHHPSPPPPPCSWSPTVLMWVSEYKFVAIIAGRAWTPTCTSAPWCPKTTMPWSLNSPWKSKSKRNQVSLLAVSCCPRQTCTGTVFASSEVIWDP